MINHIYTIKLLEHFWKKGVLLNPFCIIDKQGIDMIPAVIRAFLSSTSGNTRLYSPSFLRAEGTLLKALISYIALEAPYDEWNLCLVAELMQSVNRSVSCDNDESDLDLLFNHAKTINPTHVASKHFSAFKEMCGKAGNLVANSCKRRLSPLPTSSRWVFECVENVKQDIPNLARTFLRNLQSRPESSIVAIDDGETLLFTSVLLYSYRYTPKKDQTYRNIISLLQSPKTKNEILSFDSCNSVKACYLKGVERTGESVDGVLYNIGTKLEFFTVYDNSD